MRRMTSGGPHGRLSEEERRARVATFDQFVACIPPRPREELDRELAEERRARRSGRRRSECA